MIANGEDRLSGNCAGRLITYLRFVLAVPLPREGGLPLHIRSRAGMVLAGPAFSIYFPARARERGEDRAQAARWAAKRCRGRPTERGMARPGGRR